MSARSTTEELDAIHEALAEDGIYIHPSLESEFTPEQLSAIAENTAEAGQPVFVVAYPFSRNDTWGGSPADLLTRLQAAHPEPGLYITTTASHRVTAYEDISLEAREWNAQGGAESYVISSELSIVRYELPQTVGEAFERATELLTVPRAELRELEASAREDWYEAKEMESPRGSSSADDDGFDPTSLVVIGLVAALLAAVVWKLFARIRKQREALVLPPSAMARIRQAHDRRLEQQARDDVLALGELIDESEITAGSDAGAWQAALDHYEAARRVLGPEDVDVLDVVGAIVLAGNGVQALTDAQSGRAFAPPTRCFLNPLHGEGTALRAVEYDGRKLDAPLCKECRVALSKSSTPDILDVVRRGKPVHYFETDAEPWASTGYGALDPGLLRKLKGGN